MTIVDDAEQQLVDALRAGDERVFARLVVGYAPMMRRIARAYVADHETAEEVVQDTWLALIEGIDRFEQRSTLRTWLFRVLINIAKTRGVRDRHAVVVDPARPTATESPERRVLSAETVAIVQREIDQLPAQQRLVVSLRDVAGYGAAEVCTLLHITPANQRVLLHRGRARVRAALEVSA